MPRTMFATPEKGICLQNLSVNLSKLGSKLRRSEAVKLIRDGKNAMVWEAVDRAVLPPGVEVPPCYYLTNMVPVCADEWRTDVFITIPRRTLDGCGARVNERWVEFSGHENRLDRHMYALCKALVAHGPHWEHILHNFLPIITTPMVTEKTLDRKFTYLLRSMYGIDGLPHKPLRECVWCRTCSDQRMKRCPCGVYYCGKECQRGDWFAGHRRVCSAK